MDEMPDEESVLMKPLIFLLLVNVVLALGCTGKSPPASLSLDTPTGKLSLRTLRDVQLTGGTSRFDYQSLDPGTGRLYIAHLGAGTMTVFDVNNETVVGDVNDLPRVHGVLAVPELHHVYASATGSNELGVIDDATLKIIARVPAGVALRTVDMTMEFESLSFALSQPRAVRRRRPTE